MHVHMYIMYTFENAGEGGHIYVCGVFLKLLPCSCSHQHPTIMWLHQQYYGSYQEYYMVTPTKLGCEINNAFCMWPHHIYSLKQYRLDTSTIPGSKYVTA